MFVKIIAGDAREFVEVHQCVSVKCIPTEGELEITLGLGGSEWNTFSIELSWAPVIYILNDRGVTIDKYTPA